MQEQAREEEADLRFILGDAARASEPLQAAVEAAELTMVEKGDSAR